MELEYGTITDMDDALRATDGVDAVYHMAAAFQGGGPFTNEEYLDINVKGTFNMLEAARHHERVRHFIQASTDAQYGGHQVDQSGGELIKEDETPARPADGTPCRSTWPRRCATATTAPTGCRSR